MNASQSATNLPDSNTQARPTQPSTHTRPAQPSSQARPTQPSSNAATTFQRQQRSWIDCIRMRRTLLWGENIAMKKTLVKIGRQIVKHRNRRFKHKAQLTRPSLEASGNTRKWNQRGNGASYHDTAEVLRNGKCQLHTLFNTVEPRMNYQSCIRFK